MAVLQMAEYVRPFLTRNEAKALLVAGRELLDVDEETGQIFSSEVQRSQALAGCSKLVGALLGERPERDEKKSKKKRAAA